MTNVPNDSDAPRQRTEEEQAPTGRRHDEASRAAHRNYPMAAPAEDPRFTLGLALDVAEVLRGAGYEDELTGLDLVQLQQALYRFLYTGRSESPRAQDPVDRTGATLGDLAQRVARLEEQLAGMSGELRTRRLVVVDEDGVERITAGMHLVSPDRAELKVLAPGDDGSWVALAASSEDGGLPMVDLSLSVGGSIHSSMSAAPAVAWSEGPPEGARWTDTRSELMVAGRTVAEGCSNSGGSATGVPLPVDELRARRLVIVDEKGEERVVASAGGGASLQLYTADPDDFLELSACDGSDFDPAGPEVALRAWMGGDQIISHTAWRHGVDGESLERARLTHEGDEGLDVVGDVERIRRTAVPAHADGQVEERPQPTASEPALVEERVEYEARCLVADAEQALRLVHDVVTRYRALDGDGSGAAVVEESSARTADLLMVTYALLRHRVVSADSEADQHLADRLEAEGLA